MKSLQRYSSLVVMKSVDYSFLRDDVSKKLGLIPYNQLETIQAMLNENFEFINPNNGLICAARLGFVEASNFFKELAAENALMRSEHRHRMIEQLLKEWGTDSDSVMRWYSVREGHNEIVRLCYEESLRNNLYVVPALL